MKTKGSGEVVRVLAWILIAVSLLFPAHSMAATGNITNDLQVVVNSSEAIGSNYIEMQGTMSGEVQRDDGSQGTYKVPITIVYPQDAALCNGMALVDIINSVFYETFDFAGTANDPFFPSLFPLARMNLGDPFIQEHGYLYAQAQWNKLVLERQSQAGTLNDPSLHIDRGKDGYLVLRDLSNVLRNPQEFITGQAPMPCAVSDVVGFGYSQTGMLLRQFHFSGLNTELALSPDFDEGLVFEASLQAVAGSRCRSLTDQYPYYLYSFDNCAGETPKKQGKLLAINTETDVQMIGGWMARPNGKGSSEYYRVYEIAGTSHIPATLLPLKPAGVRPIEMAEQNFADTAPVFRAMVENIRSWITDNEAPPASVFIKGHVDQLNTSFFSSSSWGSDNNLVWLVTYGIDGNGLGGVRLPHLRTVLPGGEEVGAPLGLFRGVECNNDPMQSTYILDCQLSGDPNIYNMAGGTYKPYTEFDQSYCSTYYDSFDTYLNTAADAAAYAISKRWILAEDLDSILANAAQNAFNYPGCVP